MPKTNSCRTYLIPDNPSDFDEFSNSHTKVAEAMFRLIYDEEGGISIGLEGDWGTGKSTVINLLVSLLESENSENTNLIFNFDAWAHEGDPLRRTFLEQLIISLKSKWITEEEWKKKKNENLSWEDKWKELIGLKTKTEITNSPEITPLGICVIIAGFLVPIGLVIINDSLRNGGTFNFWRGLPWSWYLFSGTILTIMPIAVYFGGFAINKWIKKDKRKLVNWGVIVQKFDTVTISYTTKSPDPTSVEFEKFFSELVNDCLTEKRRRLILVLDNLDRISATDALSILSTMQTFLQCKSKIDPEILKRLWVIIPYDRNGLAKLWVQFDKHSIEESDYQDDSNDTVASSMIDKRFQVRFRVPPMVLSNWEKYFEEQLSKAFPDHTVEEFASTSMVFYNHQGRGKIKSEPTPRGIKLFINQIGTIHRQWGDNFPLSQMAYFVSLINRNKKIPEYFLSGNIPEKPFQDFLDENVADNIAAMWFNIEPNIAVQIILESPILDSINNRNTTYLEELAKKHKEWFWRIFNKNLSKPDLQNDSRFLLNISYCIVKNNLMVNTIETPNKTIESILRRNTQKIKSWAPLDDKTEKGLISLFEIIPDKKFIESIITSIASNDFIGENKYDAQHGLDAVTLENLGNEMVLEIDTLLNIMKTLQNNNQLSFSKNNKLIINTDCHRSVEIYSRIYNNDPEGELWGIISTTSSEDDINIALVNLINQNVFAARHIGLLSVLLDIMPEMNWKTITGTILHSLQQPQNLYLSPLLEGSWILYSREIVENDFYKQLNDSGYLLHHLILKTEVNDFLSCAWCIYISFMSPLETQSPIFERSGEGVTFLNQFLSNPTSDSNKKQIFDELVNIIVNNDKLTRIINLSKKYSQLITLVKALLIELLEWDIIGPAFTPDVLLESWNTILAYMDKKQFNRLIEKLCQEDYPIEDVVSHFSPDDAGLFSEFYESIHENKSKIVFTKQIIYSLRDVGKDRWLKALIEEDTLLELLIFLISDQQKVGLSIDFLNAYVEYCEKVLNNETQPQKYSEEWKNLPNCIGNQKIRNTLIYGVINKAKNVNNIPSIYFDLYGDLIKLPSQLMRNLDIVSRIFIPLVQMSNERGLLWLADLFENNPDLLNKYKDEGDVEVFRLQVEKALTQQNSEAVQSSFVRIARVLRIDIH